MIAQTTEKLRGQEMAMVPLKFFENTYFFGKFYTFLLHPPKESSITSMVLPLASIYWSLEFKAFKTSTVIVRVGPHWIEC